MIIDNLSWQGEIIAKPFLHTQLHARFRLLVPLHSPLISHMPGEITPCIEFGYHSDDFDGTHTLLGLVTNC